MDNVRELMQELCVSSVYWIDDDNTDWMSLPADNLPDYFASAYSSATPDQRAAVIKELNKNRLDDAKKKLRKLPQREGEDDDVFIERVSETISSLANEDSDFIDALRTVGNLFPQPISSADKEALCALFNLGPSAPWKWNQWSFVDWSQYGNQQLAQHSPSQPGLFIIDLQNKDKDLGIDGRTVLSALAKSQLPREALHILVLTAECEADSEYKLGRNLTKEHFGDDAPIQLPVFAMAKERFQRNSAGESTVPESIAEGLSRICLSFQHRELKRLLANAFTSAVNDAFTSLESLTLEEFMYAVLHRSEYEGVPEIDTLLRIVGIEQRRNLQRVVAANYEVQRVLRRIKGAGIHVSRNELATDQSIEELRVAELYDPAEVINALRSPVSPGDLFEVVTNSPAENRQIFCLVGNFCDVSLRGTGLRKLTVGLLLPLQKLLGTRDGDRNRYLFEKLNLAYPNIDADIGVEYSSLRTVSFDILDLCWTNDDGHCQWNARTGGRNQHRLSPAQIKRLHQISESLQGHGDKSHLFSAQVTIGCEVRYQELKTSCTKRKNRRRKTHLEKHRSLVTTPIASIDFGVRRIGRLSHSHATHLVSEFTDSLGRASRSHDFSSD